MNTLNLKEIGRKRLSNKEALRYANFVLQKLELAKKDINTLFREDTDEYIDIIDEGITLDEYLALNGCIGGETVKGSHGSHYYD